MSHKPVFYVYEAAIHCPEHAYARFGDTLGDQDTTDNEGNPIGAVFEWEEQGEGGDYCDECVAVAIKERHSRITPINGTPAIRKLAADNGGELPAWAWPGGYPIIYFDRDNSVLCPACANNKDASFDAPLVAYDVYWEGPSMQCDQCYKEIESAYGDPDADDDAGDGA